MGSCCLFNVPPALPCYAPVCRLLHHLALTSRSVWQTGRWKEEEKREQEVERGGSVGVHLTKEETTNSKAGCGSFQQGNKTRRNSLVLQTTRRLSVRFPSLVLPASAFPAASTSCYSLQRPACEARLRTLASLSIVSLSVIGCSVLGPCAVQGAEPRHYSYLVNISEWVEDEAADTC